MPKTNYCRPGPAVSKRCGDRRKFSTSQRQTHTFYVTAKTSGPERMQNKSPNSLTKYYEAIITASYTKLFVSTLSLAPCGPAQADMLCCTQRDGPSFSQRKNTDTYAWTMPNSFGDEERIKLNNEPTQRRNGLHFIMDTSYYQENAKMQLWRTPLVPLRADA